jgi:hypothetical protein
MADFQTIAAGIFEEDGVVSFIFPRGAFHLSRAGASGDLGQAIDFRRALRPEAIRFSLGTWLRNSVTPKNAAGPSSGAAASYWNQSGISVFHVKPSAGNSTS